MDDLPQCKTKDVLQASDHPALEPPCRAVYVMMTEEEKEKDLMRTKAHMELHLERATK